LHYSCDICHRDIKPENILFKNKDDINSLQLVDFGLSADTFEEKNYLNNCGTLKYMAPEQIANMIYSKAVDVWSVGIILYMLLNNGNNPFCNSNDSKEVIINNIKNKNIEFGENFFISEMGKNLIKKILKKNPSYRYSARLALFHPWITLNKFDQIKTLSFLDEGGIAGLESSQGFKNYKHCLIIKREFTILLKLNVEYLNNILATSDYTYYTQNQTETNYVENVKMDDKII